MRRSCRPAAIAMIVALPCVASAQRETLDGPLKPGPQAPRARPICAPMGSPVTPDADARRRTRDLVQRGQQAAILGDNLSALRALLDASKLDASDADLAYQLGRAHELMRDSVSAVREYCRFLALAPTAPDAAEVIEKIRALAPPRTDQVVDIPLAVFRVGIAAYERRQFAAADSAFTTAIAMDSTWADAYYNRARTRLSRGDDQRAHADFARYLRLSRDLGDRLLLTNQASAFGLRTYSPTRALGLGLIIPGGGQFYTRRPIRGLLTLAGVGASITAGVLLNRAEASGNAATRYRKRPYLVYGAATAGTIAAVSALDAGFFAYLSQLRPQRVAHSTSTGSVTGTRTAP